MPPAAEHRWLYMTEEQREAEATRHLAALIEYERHFRTAEAERNREQTKEVRAR